MVAPIAVRRRIKKLIALATSPEPEEAESARSEADRLMVKYGLSLADFEDDVVELVDDERDELRQRLAFAVSVSRRCKLVVNKRGQMAFRGRPTLTTDARDLYHALVDDVVANCEIGPRDPGRDTWRICYWIGFVDAVVSRLVDDEARGWMQTAETPRETKEREALAPVAPVQVELARATAEFRSHFAPQHADRGVAWLKSDAYAAGKSCGLATHIEPRQAAPKRALGGWNS